MQGKRSNPYYVAQEILSRRDHSEVEMRQKLTRKGFTQPQIVAVVERLKQQHLLNDRMFARNYGESILRLKAVGPRWLHSKFLHKGIPSDVAREIVEELFGSHDEAEVLRQAAERWRATHRGYAHDVLRLKRFLVSRGFSVAIIEQELSAHS